MSAELLRRAASEIRTTATLAQIYYDGRNPGDWGAFDPGEASDEERHIALWSPDVALLVADRLDHSAFEWTATEEATSTPHGDLEGWFKHDLAIARLILGEPK